MFTAATTYEHTQSVALDVWEIVHNLGVKAPIVDCWLDVAGEIVKVLPNGVVFVDINTCNVQFASPQVGTAIIA
jgi:hypothetical protein